VKRSHSIVLALLGGASVGALAGCSQRAPVVRITPDAVYANNYFVPGVGYYHAPFNGFFAHPYNFYDAATHRYYFGGQWGAAPHQSIVNISAPSAGAARYAELYRTDVIRGGFGSYYGGGHYYGGFGS